MSILLHRFGKLFYDGSKRISISANKSMKLTVQLTKKLRTAFKTRSSKIIDSRSVKFLDRLMPRLHQIGFNWFIEKLQDNPNQVLQIRKCTQAKRMRWLKNKTA